MTSDLATTIGPVGILADAAVKATVLLVLSWAIAGLLRRRSAALRHRVWALAMGGTIAIPVASWLVPGWRLPWLPAATRAAVEVAPAVSPAPAPVEVSAPVTSPVRAIPEPVEPPSRVEVVAPLPSASPRASWTIPGGWLSAWGVGAVAAVLPTLLGLLGNRRLRRRSRSMDDPEWRGLLDGLRRDWSIGRRVELRRGGETPIPLTWGVLRPLILVPDDAPGWPERKRRLVLLHELAHIRRLDAGVQLLGRLAAALYWFHPLAWYALHRMRVECEHACDDCVVLAGERPTDYAGQLLELARSVRAPRIAMTIAMARTNALEDRLVAMFDETRSHRALDRRAGRRLAAVAATVVVGLAMVRPGPSAARPGAPEEAPAPAPVVDEPPAKGTGRITGRVVRDGAAGGAEVVLLLPPPKGQSYYIGKPPLRRVMADAGGLFAFEELPPGRYRVWANLGKLTSRPREGRGEVVTLPEAGPGPGPVELRLAPGIRVTVTVKEKATGRPIAGATISTGWSDLVDNSITDRDGRALVQPLTAKRWRFNVWADGFAMQTRAFNLENGSDAEADFALEPGGDLEGVVRDPDGRPVPGVGLGVSLEGSYEQFASVEADAQGRYRLRHLPLNHPMKIHNQNINKYFDEATPVLLTGRSKSLDLRLRLRPHGGSIVGVVRDQQGRPIAGAEVINPSRKSGDFRQAKTGPDGRFRLDDLYESITGKEVIARAPGFAPRRMRVEPGPADRPAEVTIAMEPGHRIRGRVADDRGRPIEGVRVFFGGADHGYQGGGESKTDAQGRFAFDSLPAGTPFSFYKDGYSEIDNRPLPLDTGDVVDVAMDPAGVIGGRVLDARTGRPIRAFHVDVTFSPQRRPDEPSAGLRADLGGAIQSDEGRFRVGDLVLGMPLQVTVSADGYERGVVERIVVARADEARPEEFRLAPVDPATLRTYRGRLRDAAGKPVVGAQLRLIAARDRDPDRRSDFPFNWTMIRNGQLAQQSKVVRFVESATDARGIFEFAGIPRGTEVELAWWGRGIAPGRADHLEEQAEAKEGWFDITLPAPARIVVRMDRNAYPKAGRVQLGGSIALCDFADIELKPDQAAFAFEDLAPGDYTVNLTTPFEASTERPGGLESKVLATVNLTVQAGESREVAFRP